MREISCWSPYLASDRIYTIEMDVASEQSCEIASQEKFFAKTRVWLSSLTTTAYVVFGPAEAFTPEQSAERVATTSHAGQE